MFIKYVYRYAAFTRRHDASFGDTLQMDLGGLDIVDYGRDAPGIVIKSMNSPIKNRCTLNYASPGCKATTPEECGKA